MITKKSASRLTDTLIELFEVDMDKEIELIPKSTAGLNPLGILQMPDKESELAFAQLEEAFKHDIFDTIEKPPVIYSIGGEIVGTSGNLSLFLGRAKTKKTMLTSLITASAITGKDQGDIRVTLPTGKNKIVFFDTEQSNYHVSLMTNRVLRLVRECGKEIKDQEIQYRFNVFKLRTADSVEERVDFIEHIIYRDNEIGMVIIDGIRDLLSDFNDPGKSMDITCSLMRWSQERDIHILSVLHTNKGDYNARGHLGTELTNKSESVIMVKNIDDIYSYAEPEYVRNRPFMKFAFYIDENGLPRFGDVDSDQSKNRKITDPKDIDPEQFQDCCKDWKNLKTSEANKALRDYFDFSDKPAREYIKFIVGKNIVSKTQGTGNSCLYSFNGKMVQ